MRSCMIIYYFMEENIFCHYRLQAFRTAEIKNCKKCFKINGKQTMKMPKKSEYITFRNFGRKMKPPCMIYANFESV